MSVYLLLIPLGDVTNFGSVIQYVFKNKNKLIYGLGVHHINKPEITYQGNDFAPIKKIIEVSKKYNALTYLDEVHGVGLYGKNGGQSFGWQRNLVGIDLE